MIYFRETYRKTETEKKYLLTRLEVKNLAVIKSIFQSLPSNYFKNLTPSLLKNSGISKSPHNVTSMYEVVCTPIYLFEIMKDYLTFYCFIRAASKANLRAIFKLIIFYDLIIARSLRYLVDYQVL